MKSGNQSPGIADGKVIGAGGSPPTVSMAGSIPVPRLPLSWPQFPRCAYQRGDLHHVYDSPLPPMGSGNSSPSHSSLKSQILPDATGLAVV